MGNPAQITLSGFHFLRDSLQCISQYSFSQNIFSTEEAKEQNAIIIIILMGAPYML
ncbi:hypothetical protein GBA52_013923 [Prunus armeniaca]|nr:hypothetical protein GBA52_013923 [Prunus armeniaca]